MGLVYDDNTGNYRWEDDEPQGGQQTAPPDLRAPADPRYDTPPGNNQWGISIPSPNDQSYDRDLAYWLQHGVTPTGPEGIFDANGQVQNGWQRTARGYERTGASGTNTTLPPNIPTTYGGGGGDWGYLTQPYGGKPPAYQSAGPWAAPTFTRRPDFSYKEFQVPTKDSIYEDPSYQFRLQQGEQALGQHAASMGNYRTGGTLKDFVNYNQNAASQEYGNIFGRAVDTHNLGLKQNLDTYALNEGLDLQSYDRLFNASKAQYEAQERDTTRLNQSNFDSFLADYDIFDRDRKRAGGFLFNAAGLGG